MQALSKAKPGETYTIKWMFGEAEALEFMRRYSVEQGSQIKLIRRCAGSVVIGNGLARLAIGKEVADRIQV